MAYTQITPPLGDLNHQPAVPFNGNYETIQGCFRLIDAMLLEIYSLLTGGVTGLILVTDSAPGSGSIVGYSPTGFGATCDRLDIAANDANTTLKDLPAGFDGQRLRIRNTGATGILTLNTENAASVAANRFLGAGHLAMLPGDKADLIYYAGSINRWTM